MHPQHKKNECLTGSHACHQDSYCKNTDGSFRCECEIGYVGDGFDCKDVDECSNGMNTCQANSECKNTIGSFTCFCVTGYDFNDDGECVDVDECQFGPCGNHMTCQNSFGSYECVCNEGLGYSKVFETNSSHFLFREFTINSL